MTAIAFIRLVKALFEEAPYIGVKNVKGLVEQVMDYPIMINFDNSLKLHLLQDHVILAPEGTGSNRVLTFPQFKREGGPPGSESTIYMSMH